MKLLFVNGNGGIIRENVETEEGGNVEKWERGKGKAIDG